MPNVRDALERISDWKREANLEDPAYFFKIPVVNKIMAGKQCFVTGRKGTGKTAICRYINTLTQKNKFSVLLSFKDFPFDELYRHPDYTYPDANHYVSLWMYIIYVELLRLMSTNGALNYDARKQLTELFPAFRLETTADRVRQINKVEFGVSLLGLDVKGKGEKGDASSLQLRDKIRVLMDFVTTEIDGSQYYILFDYLDEDYRDILSNAGNQRYIDLIAGLFKAVQYIKEYATKIGKDIFPVIFLREDIFGILGDNDRTKWLDYRANINWTVEEITRVLSHRISRDLQNEADLPFEEAWKSVTLSDPIIVGRRTDQPVSVFSYVIRRTQIRPRDFIDYIKLAAERTITLKEKEKITPSVWQDVELEYSNRLRSEIEDELWGALPKASQLFDILQYLGERRFYIDEFTRAFSSQASKEIKEKLDPQTALKILYSVGAIGTIVSRRSDAGSAYLFIFENERGGLNLDARMQVHPGLYRSLSL